MGVQEYYYPRQAYPTPSSKLPTLPRPSREPDSDPIRTLFRGAYSHPAFASSRTREGKARRANTTSTTEKKGKPSLKTRPLIHALPMLFKRGSLKRTRFTFIAVHSARDREGEKEKETGRDSTQFGTKQGRKCRSLGCALISNNGSRGKRTSPIPFSRSVRNFQFIDSPGN